MDSVYDLACLSNRVYYEKKPDPSDMAHKKVRQYWGENWISRALKPKTNYHGSQDRGFYATVYDYREDTVVSIRGTDLDPLHREDVKSDAMIFLGWVPEQFSIADKFKKKSRFSFFSFFLIFIVILAITPFQALAAQEGISIALQGSQSLYLYKDCYALVVGVGNYDQWPDLPNAVNDAKEVSGFFKQRGFKVKLVLDPGSQDLKKALDDFAREAGQEPDRAIVFYYVGHGKTQTLNDGSKLDWIIPRDCPLLRDQDNSQGDRAFASQAFASRAINLKTIEKFS